VTLQLDDVPEEIERIVLAASLDTSLGVTFGAARFVRLRVQRTSDAVDLVHFDIADASQESALLFGEFYRRRGEWRVRAIGQGYAGGLASLIADFGVEVDQDHGGEDESAAQQADALDAPANVDLESGPIAPERVSVRRTVRAPKMPAAWNKAIPSDDDVDWQSARLFPVAGIGGPDEQERRSTSALLAVLRIVKEFGRDITSRLGAPSGSIRTYTEVTFGHDDEAVRPDGVIRIRRGQREWVALVEVKTSDGRLAAPQIEAYLEVAKAKGYNAVITISNQLTGAGGEHPVLVDRRKLKQVELHHMAWDEIRARARILSEHRGLVDATQHTILEEFLRYMAHPRSGVHGFTDMGKQWVQVRDGVKAKTQRSSDRSTSEVSAHFDQLVAHTGFHLSGLLGVEVQVVNSPSAPDSASRCQQLADSGLMFGSLRVPGTLGAMVITADIRTDKVTCSVTIPAPREGKPLTRVNWLLRQIPDARDTTRIVALATGGRDASRAALLRQLRPDPNLLVPTDGRDIRSFRVELELPMGSKRSAGTGALIDSVVGVTSNFYAEVVQNLRAWSGRPPRVPA
jgi:hypothetical protein